MIDINASEVSLTQGGTIQDNLHLSINVAQFSVYNSSDDDWGPAFRAARDKAIDIGASAVYFSGNYKIKAKSGPTTFTTPFDDGSFDSRRSGETLLDPEPQYKIPVGLEWPSGLSLKSSGIGNNSITFDWDNLTVGLEQGIGICIRVRNWDGTYIAKAGAVNRMMSDVANVEFDGFSINNAFIGVVGDGIVGSVTWGALQFKNCGIPICWQGADRSTIKKLRFSNCAAGIIIGGWWLTRNDISGSNGGLGVPPYVSDTDVYCIGWVDFVKIDNLEYSNNVAFNKSSLFSQIDMFFDTYFYKSSNSNKTSEGGRVTNTGPNLTSVSTLASDSPFLGIAGRACSQLGRYHRYHILNEILSLKTWGCFRAAILTTYNGESESNVPGCVIGTAYIEQGCKVNPNSSDQTVGGDNDFITSGSDSWKGAKKYSKYYAGEGSVVVKDGWPVNTLGLFSAARTVARNDNGYNNRLRRTVLDDGTGKTIIPEQLTEELYITPPQKYIPNAVGEYDSKYYWKFFESNVSSKMTLYAGVPTASSQTVITTPSSKAFMERIGNRVKLKINFNSSNYLYGGDKQVVIGFVNIYKPILTATNDYALAVYGPVKTTMISATIFTVLDTGSILRTFRIEPVAYQVGSYNNAESVHYYFSLLTQHHTSSENQFLWSNFTGSLCQIEIEYDTADDVGVGTIF